MRRVPGLVLRLVAGLAVLAGLVLVVLDSPLGHRLVADRVAELRMKTGLVVTIGRIDGSLYRTAQLHDVTLFDPRGAFMTVPQVTLDWRPLGLARLALGLGGDLDIRDLTLHRGQLLRAPQLRPADPDTPILPDFDIRLDRFAIDGLTVAPGLAGARRRVDWAGSAHVAAGRVIAHGHGRLGGEDRLAFDLDSEPDRDRFALGLDYQAPVGGLLQGLTRVPHALSARIGGAGRFAAWRGWVIADADRRRLIGGTIDNRGGQVRLALLVRPAAGAGGWIAALGGDRLGVTFAGTVAAARASGQWHAANALARIEARGAIDLAHNRVDAMMVDGALLRPELLPAAWREVASPGAGRISGRIDGAFGDLALAHEIVLSRLDVGAVRLSGLRSSGVAHWTGGRLSVPVQAGAARVETGTGWLDQHLAGVRLNGRFVLDGNGVSGDGLQVSGRGLAANLVLKGQWRQGAFALAGRLDARGFDWPQVATLDGTAKAVIAFGRGVPWTLAANYAGDASRFGNGAAVALAGERARLTGSLHWGAGRSVTLPDMTVTAARLSARVRFERARDGRIVLAASGAQQQAGPFDGAVTFADGGATGHVLLAKVAPALGPLQIDLSGQDRMYRVTAAGTSQLGPISASAAIVLPARDDPGGRPQITLNDARVFDTRISGGLALAADGLNGELALNGGGISGTLALSGTADGQVIRAALHAGAARLGSERPIVIGAGDLTGTVQLARSGTRVEASLRAQGLSIGSLFIGRLIADARMVDGAGSATVSLGGRRGTQLALQGTATFTPERLEAYLAGNYAGNPIAMPRRAVVERAGDGWRLLPSQINFGPGALIASGELGGGPTELHLAVSRMPLSVLDIGYADLGLGGYASGVIEYRNDHTGVPEGHADLQVMGMTRSGLVLTSRPLDVALVGRLDAHAAQVRAVAREGGVPRMRLEAVIDDLPRGGSALDRLRGGQLRGRLRYAGPADALWRLAAVDAFDLTGPVGLAADVSGRLDAPVLRGAVISHALRAQSAVSGSDIKAIDLAGRFDGNHLALDHVAGVAPNGGRVAGSGTIDFSDVSNERPRVDLRLGATNAELVNRPDMGATITGPVRIVSDGHGGTVAGRLRLDKARWVLGRASAVQSLPMIAVTERNAPMDVAPPPPRGVPWHLLIDAVGTNRIDVHGLGLESEWQADLHLRGDTATPVVIGSADAIRGSYEFAGKRFDLTRGHIRFGGETPIDPQLDIVATGDANDIAATITIGGSAQRPQFVFASVPALPEEELLSRILFGSSITQISAPEAVQLAAALAALRGGGGLDPINKLRSAIGLDRLRVLSADPTIGRGTALAVGKYLGRRFYVELVTDGHGYNATSIEFRLTRWLALLGTVSTLYDESIGLKFNKDY